MPARGGQKKAAKEAAKTCDKVSPFSGYRVAMKALTQTKVVSALFYIFCLSAFLGSAYLYITRGAAL